MTSRDADRCRSPDSNFVICLSADTRGADQEAMKVDLQSPRDATTPDEAPAKEPNSSPLLPPTVSMLSPTVSVVVSAAKTVITTTPVAGTITAAKKVVKTSRYSTPTAETLQQKQSAAASKGAANVAVIIEKPAAVFSPAVGQIGNAGLLQEENKAPSPGRGTKHPLGLPPLLRRSRTTSAQPASCGKQAALPAAPASELKKRANTSVSPIGLGGAALPLPPSKKARTVSFSPAALAASKIIEEKKQQQQQEQDRLDVGQNLRKKDKTSASLRTSFKAPPQQKQQQQAVDIPLKNTAPVQPQHRASRRQTKRNIVSSVVPAWVQKAASAPKVNAVLLSATEKIKPPGNNSTVPAWKVDDKKESATDLEINISTDKDNANRSALFVPGWEAIYQIADLASGEYEECETVAEMFSEGAGKLATFKAQKEFSLPLNLNFNSASSLGAFSNSARRQLSLADSSLYRQGFGVSEFAARMSLVASEMAADVAEKESLYQRTIRVLGGNGIPSTDVADATAQGKAGQSKEVDIGKRKTRNFTSAEADAEANTSKQQQQLQQRAPFALGNAISNAVAPFLRATSRNNNRNRLGGHLAGNTTHGVNGAAARLGPGKYTRGGKGGYRSGAGGHGVLKRSGEKKKPGAKPRNGGGGGGAGMSSRRKNHTSSVESEEEDDGEEEAPGRGRLVPPPKIWPPSENQFVGKGSGRASMNINEIARGKKPSGSGLDMQLWKKLWKEQAAEHPAKR